LTAPSSAAQADVIRRALDRAGKQSAEVTFVETHGTGTVLGDAIELDALRDVFGPRADDHLLPLGAAKTIVGHLLAAAGMAALVKAVLTLEHRRLPPNRNFGEPNPILRRAPWLWPAAAPVDFSAADEPLIGGVSAFGWSGTNAHAVLQEAPAAAHRATHTEGPVVLTLAAHSHEALDGLTDALADHVESGRSAIADVAHTLQVGRSRQPVRLALLCDDDAGAIRQCRSHASPAVDHESVRHAARVAFAFPRECGLDLAGARQAASAAPVASEVLEAVLAVLGVANEHQVPSPVTTFALQYAMASALTAAGLTPAAVSGSGPGGWVARCVAGTATLDQAVAGWAVDHWQSEADAALDALDADVVLWFGAHPPERTGPDFGPAVVGILEDSAGSQEPRRHVLAAIAHVWETGADLDWPALTGAAGQVVTIPGHPFIRRRYWPATTRAAREPLHAMAAGVSPQRVPMDDSVAAVEPVPEALRQARPPLRAPFVAPRTPRESLLAEVFCMFLGLREAGIDDPFFELGGRSISVVAILREIEQRLGTPLAPAILFEHPTVRDLAAALETNSQPAEETDRLDQCGRRGSRTIVGPIRRRDGHKEAAR
jgi:acyl transferase domain-containing protein